VRDYAAAKGLADEAAIEDGLSAKAPEFKQAGGSLYVPVTAPQAGD